MRALRRLLHVGDSPHRTALAFGIGLFIAFFPVLGTHTLIALGLAFAFRLNRVAILVGAYVNNPWTLGPLYLVGTLIGCALLGVPTRGLAQEGFSGADLGGALFQALRPYFWPFVIGNLVAGALAGVLGYLGLRRVLEQRASIKGPERGTVASGGDR